MNLRNKVMGTVGVAAAAAAIGASPIAASAAGYGAGVVAFTGATTSLTCTPNAVNVSGLSCASAGANYIPLVGGTGNYSFGTSAWTPAPPCVEYGAEVEAPGDGDGVPVPPPPASAVGEVEAFVSTGSPNCSISSSGHYINVVCGTGAVDSGTATITESNGDTATVNIVIPFVGGVGVVIGENLTGAEGGNPAAAVGIVDISPPVGSTPSAPVCVSSFDVAGVVVVGDGAGGGA